jgi:hypothetical protein
LKATAVSKHSVTSAFASTRCAQSKHMRHMDAADFWVFCGVKIGVEVARSQPRMLFLFAAALSLSFCPQGRVENFTEALAIVNGNECKALILGGEQVSVEQIQVRRIGRMSPNLISPSHIFQTLGSGTA